MPFWFYYLNVLPSGVVPRYRKLSIYQLVKFVVVDATHLGSNTSVVSTTNYSFSGVTSLARCP